MNADTRNGNSAEDQSPMTAVRKFLFENSFDDEEPEEVVPTFSEEEVNAAREEGFAAGEEEGIREAAELWREINKIVERNLSGEPEKAEAPAERPLDLAQEPEQPETPEDAPDQPGDEDTSTDQEDS